VKFREIQGTAVFNRRGDSEIALPVWGAHAPRVLVSAPRRNKLFGEARGHVSVGGQVRDGEGATLRPVAIPMPPGACAPRRMPFTRLVDIRATDTLQ
jgi:hypothetical protein